MLKMRGVCDPWQYLADRHPGVKVHLRADLGRRWGQTVWRGDSPEIHLAIDLGRVQRRCTLAHELQHVERGAPCRPLCPGDEAAVVDATARFLLPDLALLARTLAGLDLDGAAAALQVTRTVLTDRIDAMTDDELAEMGETLREHTAPAGDGQAACIHPPGGTDRRRPSRARKPCCRRVPRGAA